MLSFLDDVILFIGLLGIAFILSIIFRFNAKVAIIVYMILAALILFTEDGIEIRKKISIFDKTSTWNTFSKGVVVIQCSSFTTGNLTLDMNEITRNTKNSDEKTKEAVRCCANKIFRNISQEEYFKQTNVMHIIFDAIEQCKK